MFNLRTKLKRVIALGCAIMVTLSGTVFEANQRFRSIEIVKASTAGTTAYAASKEFNEITIDFIDSRVSFEDRWDANKIYASDLMAVEDDIFEISNFFEKNLNNIGSGISSSNETAYSKIEEFYYAISNELNVKSVFVSSVNIVQEYKSNCTSDNLEKATNLLSAIVDYQEAVNNTMTSVEAFLSKYTDNKSFLDTVKLTADFNGGTYTKQDNTVMTSDIVERFAYSKYRPAQPTKEGYIFSGWQLVKGDGELKNNIYYFGTEDAILKAVWTEEATPTPTIVPTKAPIESTPTAIPTSTIASTMTPSPGIAVTSEPTEEPSTVTATPFVTQPTVQPPMETVTPSIEGPTIEPPTETVTPSTESPVVETMEPTETPILETEEPTQQPTQEPSNNPTELPTTNNPTVEPSIVSTIEPTSVPVVTATAIATQKPTALPVVLKKKTIKIGKGEKVSFPLKNTTGKKIKYTVKNKKIASVSSKGIIKGKKVGQTKVYATVSGKKFPLTVKVRKKPVSIKISSVSNVKMSIGGKLILQAIMNSGATSYKLKWSSSNKKVVTVNGSGVATIKGKGKAVIKVKTYNGVTGTLKLNIK